MILAALMFFVGVGFVLGAYWLATHLPERWDARKLQRRLHGRRPDRRQLRRASRPIVTQQSSGPLPALDKLVNQVKATSWLARLIERSGKRVTPSGILITVAWPRRHRGSARGTVVAFSLLSIPAARCRRIAAVRFG